MGKYYDACLPFGLWESLIFGNAVLTSVRIIKSTKGGDCIGRMLVIEFNESDSGVFDKVIEVVQGSNNFETLQVKVGNTISLPGLTIHLNRRKIYRERQELSLTAKEYDLLCLFAANREQVLTYTQIYEKVWGSTFSGNEKVIRYHLYNLRKKINLRKKLEVVQPLGFVK